MNPVRIRIARPSDAAAACAVMRRSIVELCQADHGGDAKALETWLANKQPEIVARWIAGDPEGYWVAVDGEAIQGIAAIRAGEILLNYVSPDARFRGVSRALIERLEQRARESGWERLTLTSTVTAHRFYRARGYTDSSAPIQHFGMTAYPMAKSLPIVGGNG
jgi:GNAT superfamily N-acetyltransferase